ncbi:MAG: hypothetical protein AABZ63_02730 [Actinomycetota bacterium]
MVEVTPERQALLEQARWAALFRAVSEGEHVTRLLSERLPDPFGQDEKVV